MHLDVPVIHSSSSVLRYSLQNNGLSLPLSSISQTILAEELSPKIFFLLLQLIVSYTSFAFGKTNYLKFWGALKSTSLFIILFNFILL